MADFLSEIQIPCSDDVGKLVDFEVESEDIQQLPSNNVSFQDKAGGFFYKHNERLSRSTRSRIITWKVSDNYVHLTEISQDLQLYHNCLKIKLKDLIVLPHVCIHESSSAVYIVLCTQNSVHRLCFSHPVKETQGAYVSCSLDASAPSIFNSHPTGITAEPWCFATLPKACHTFQSHQNESGECLITLITNEGSLLLVTLPAFNKQVAVQVHELKQTSMMKRLWTGLIPSAFRGENLPHDSVQSVTVEAAGESNYVFALCRDLKIRIWSCKSLECIEEEDLVSFLPDVTNQEQAIAQSYLLRTARDETTDVLFICVFLNFRFQSQFVAFEAIEDDGDIELSLLSSHFSKMTTLSEFCLTSKHIWAMWTTGSGEAIIQYAPIEVENGQETVWNSVNVVSSKSPEFSVDSSTEPRKWFLEKLFTPGSFSKDVLIKTMQMTVKSLEENLNLEVSASSTMDELQEALEQLMLLEMQSYVSNYEVGQEEYYSLQMQCWGRFYASAVQYDQVDRKPISIFADYVTGFVGIIRQNYRGYLYANSWIESLYLKNTELQEHLAGYIQEKADLNNLDLANEIIIFMNCLRSIQTQLSRDSLNDIERSLEDHEDMAEVLSSVANSIMNDSSETGDVFCVASQRNDFMRNIELKMKDMVNLLDVLTHVTDALDPSKWLPSDFEATNSEFGAFSLNTSYSFGSNEGRSVLTEAILNRAKLGINICRDLLLFINILTRIISVESNCVSLLGSDVIVPLKTGFIPRVQELLYSYFTIVWLGRKAFVDENSDSVEESLKKFAALELVDVGDGLRRRQKKGSTAPSLLKSFVCNISVPLCLSIFEKLPVPQDTNDDDDTQRKIWKYDFKMITDMCIRLLWPSRKGTKLPEYLLSQGQFTPLIQYLKICEDWCTVNRGSREFLSGQAYLQNNELQKALEHFFKSSTFIGQEEELISRLIPEDVENIPDMIVAFLIKVMRLFEQFEALDMVILVATTAVVVAKKSNKKDVAMLWSNIFKCHMQLGQNKEAYQAIICNPDNLRRRNCLHNFIITLCERGEIKEICEFSYSSMEDEVISIIETRARTVDITVNEYYDLLYAFHIFRSDHRRAATAMYEYACRLCTEMHGLASLQQQAKCYLAAINCLQICDPDYAWIVRPIEKPTATRLQNITDAPNRSPKRTEDGDEIEMGSFNKIKSTKKTVIVDLADLQKEYLLILARLNLVQFDKSVSAHIGPSMTASETLPLLIQAGLFDRASSIAVLFKLDLGPIFEGLAGKCVKIGNDTSQGILSDETWSWLATNDLGTAQSTKDISAVEQAWHLLQRYLERFSKRDGFIYYKLVSRKLLSLGCSLPAWLVNSYKEKNCAELIQLYIKFDLLEDAANLAIEYINAVCGLGKEYFGLKHALHAATPSVWLPYTALDQLSHLLEENYECPRSQKMYSELQTVLKRYFDTVQTVSQDKITLLYRSKQTMMIT
eukprot:gene16776-18471_t